MSKAAVRPSYPALITGGPWLLFAAIALDGVSAYFAARQTPGVLPAIPWLVSLPLCVAAFSDKTARAWPRRDLVIAGMLLAAALVSRLLFISRWPSFINPDEPIFGLLSIDLLNGKSPAFSRGWLGEPYVSLLPTAAGIRLLGQTMSALRAPEAIIGVLAIPTLYIAAKDALGWMAALFGSLFLLLNVAVFHLSRTGLTNIQAVTLVVVGAAALVQVSLNPAQARQWAILGLTIGLTLCVFSSALVWPLVAAVTLLPLLPRVVRDKQLVALAVVPLVAGVLISAAPMLVYLERNPLELAGHASAMAIWSRDVQQHEESGYHLQHGDTASLWRIQIQRSLGAFVSQSDTQEDYRSERGLLDPVAAVAFVLGLAVLVARWRSLSTLLLGTWIVATLFLGSVIIEDPPQATKLLVLMPAVCLVAGIGLEQLLRGLAPTKPPHFTAIIGIICIVVGAGFGFSYYFGRYQLLPGQTTTVLARYIGSVQTQRPVYLVNLASVPPGNETIGYLAPHATVLAWDTRKAPPAVSVNRPLAFIMPDSGAEGDQAWTTVRRTFPSGEERFLSDSNGRPVLRVWEVPPNSTKVG